jgi:hypothetical protein
MSGMIIVTAENADAALINRLLLYVRNWEFMGDHLDDADSFRVLFAQKELATIRQAGYEVTRPPVQELPDNEWEGLSLEEVERIMIGNDEEGSTSLFLLLDDEGVENQTILVVHRAWNDPEEDKFAYVDAFNKTRVPGECVYMWCNLDIANMGFEEFCAEEDVLNSTKGGAPPRRWWTYKNFSGEDYYEPYKAKAEEAIKELRKLDLA